MSKQEKKFVYKTTLKTVFGLTDKMIMALGEPDKWVPNPHYRSGPKAGLYSIERVERWIDEHRTEVEKAAAERVKRSASAKATTDRRVEAILAWAENVNLIIHAHPRGQKLQREVEAAFRDFAVERGSHDGEFTPSDNALIAHIRHAYTNYHDLLDRLEGKPGCADAYLIIKSRLNQQIAGRLRLAGDLI